MPRDSYVLLTTALGKRYSGRSLFRLEIVMLACLVTRRLSPGEPPLYLSDLGLTLPDTTTNTNQPNPLPSNPASNSSRCGSRERGQEQT